MRNAFADELAQIGEADPRTYIVVADISPAGPMAEFRERFPERFINAGVAEQAMIGVSAGLALRGLRPFAYTIATFALYRPFEFIRDDLAYQNLPVTVVGIGGGVIYSALGATHHAQEDIAIASAVPNMSVIAPCDPLEARAATRFLASRGNGGPAYLRLAKAGEPTITSHAVDSFHFGRIRRIEMGTGDIAVLSYGVALHLASEVAAALRARGESVSLISCPTLKPLDLSGISEILKGHNTVIVMEEHAPQGGLASQVEQLAWRIQATCRLATFTLKDEFIHTYGTHMDLLGEHGLTPSHVLHTLDGSP